MRRLDALETALSLLGAGDVSIVSYNMIEEDIVRLMRQPWTMTASDGALIRAGSGVPHPRGNGAFPRKLRKYALDDAAVDLASAIRSMTSLPASVYNLPDRGVIRVGAYADVVVFDANRVRDRATYEQPHAGAEGMVHVVVNGVPAMMQGAFTATAGGQVLRRR